MLAKTRRKAKVRQNNYSKRREAFSCAGKYVLVYTQLQWPIWEIIKAKLDLAFVDLLASSGLDLSKISCKFTEKGKFCLQDVYGYGSPLFRIFRKFKQMNPEYNVAEWASMFLGLNHNILEMMCEYGYKKPQIIAAVNVVVAEGNFNRYCKGLTPQERQFAKRFKKMMGL
jgi:hypothetical protein